MDTREVYLAVIGQDNGRYHWGIYISDDIGSDQGFGKLIHVVGTPYTGYYLEIRHHWSWTMSIQRRSIQMVLLGQTPVTNIVDHASAGYSSFSGRPAIEVVHGDKANKDDAFERWAARIRPPGVIPPQFHPPAGSTPSQVVAHWRGDIPGAIRCQEWTRDQYVPKLIEKGLLPPSAMDAIRAAPRVFA